MSAVGMFHGNYGKTILIMITTIFIYTISTSTNRAW